MYLFIFLFAFNISHNILDIKYANKTGFIFYVIYIFDACVTVLHKYTSHININIIYVKFKSIYKIAS